MGKRKTIPRRGDVYAIELPNGKWSAITVLKEVDSTYLLYTTSYYEMNPPQISNPNLKRLYYREDIYSEEPAPQIYWVEGMPSKNYELIGNIELADKMNIEESNVYAGMWKDFLPMYLVYDEEEIIEEKEVPSFYTKEIEENTSSINELDDTTFWELILRLDFQSEIVTEDLIAYLSHSSIEMIFAFEETLAHKLFLLDTPLHAHNKYLESDYFSPDAFLYARCAVIGKGQESFEQVLTNPEKMNLEDELEELLTVASEAYRRKTDELFDYASTYDYETFSNEIAWSKK